MMPPVPARRTKRKMMTTEDSRPLNTGMNEQTIFIMPPPRRKHKPQTSQLNLSTSSDQRENVFPTEDNRVTHVLNNESASSNRGMSSSPTLTACTEKDLVEKSRLPTEELTDHKVCSELKTSNVESDLEILVHVDGTDDSLEGVDKSSAVLTPNHKSCVESNIFEMFIDNRVLELPLVADHYGSVSEKLDLNKGLESEIKTSIPENSATIVGVFYKPEYSLLSEVNEKKSVMQISSLDTESRLWQSSTLDCCEKVTSAGLGEESKKTENKALEGNKDGIKESEENDSGVYFSDTKSPPFRESYFDQEDVADKEDKLIANLPPYSSSQYLFTCNDRDTHDNKTIEDSGSKSYRNMLDDFEGQTVKALREEVTSLFSVCNGEVSKTQVVEDWLDGGKYLLEKKSNKNFSEYLKTMLYTESQRDSLSPYPLSTVDEDDRSDVVSEDLQESRLKEGVIRNGLSGASFTKPISSLDYIESSESSSNNNRPIDVVNNINVYYVNTECKVTTSKSKPVDRAVKNNLKGLQTEPNGQEGQVETSPFISEVTNNTVTPIENVLFRNHNLDLIVSKSLTPASAVKQGAVTSLIAYFENIKNQEFEPSYSDESCSVKEDESMNDPEENEGIDAIPTRGYIDSSENVDQMSENEGKRDCDEYMCCSPVATQLCQDHCLNERDTDSKGLTTFKDLREDKDQQLFLFQEQPEIENSESVVNGEFEHTNKEIHTIITNTIDLCDVQTFRDEESMNEENYEDNKDKHLENTASSLFEDTFCSNELIDNDEKQLDGTFTVDLKDTDYLTKVEAIVPTHSNVTKEEIVNNEDSLPAFKPTMIPVVVLTEADCKTNLIGSIELHSSLQDADDNAEYLPEMSEASRTEPLYHHVNHDNEDSIDKPESDNAAIEVVLEKNWGSVGFKLQGDGQGVIVSDILAGGSADESGLIFQGDRLLGVNGQCVRTTIDAEELLRNSADVVHLQLQRNGVSQSLPRHGIEDTTTMGSNMSRHSGKGLTGRRSQSQGNLCNGKSSGAPGVARFFSPCGRNNDSVGPRDRYKFCGSLPNHLDSKEHPLEEVCEPEDLTSYRNNNNVRVVKKSDVVLRLQPLVPHGGYKDPMGGVQDQGYASERSPEDELPPDLPPPETADQLTCPVHHPANKPLPDYPFLHKNSIFTVTVMKGTRGLGLSVTGGVDTQEPWPGLIRIKRLFPHQPAWQSGQLAQGDFLLAANNTSLFRLTNYEALEVLRTTPAEVVLTVCRPPPELQVLTTPFPLPGDSAPLPPRRDPNSTSSLQLPLKRMESFGEFEITLKKVNGSLGFTLRKEDESVLGHYVRALVREPALSDGRIKPGDKIVAVNNTDMSPMSHEEAVLFLRQCGQEVQLKLYRDPAQTPVQALSPTEHHRTFKPILRKEAQDMLSDLAVKKSMSPKDSSSSSTLSSTGRTSSPRKRRLTKTPSPDLEAVRRESQLSWSEEVLERISPGTEGDRPRRPDSLNFTAERKPHFQFSAAASCRTEESLNSLDSFECGGSLAGGDSELGVGPLPTEPVSMPPLLTSASDSNVGFSYRNPAYRSANPAPSKSKSSLSEELPEGRSSDNDLTGGEGGVEGSKGLLKWKGIVFTPEDGAENEAGTSPEDSVSQITEVDNSSQKVVVVELNRGWSSRLGFSLKEEDHKTYISAIHPDSVASRDGRLKTGDQLIMVNDEGIDGMSTAEVIDLLRKIRGSICITVWRTL